MCTVKPLARETAERNADSGYPEPPERPRLWIQSEHEEHRRKSNKTAGKPQKPRDSPESEDVPFSGGCL